MKGIRTTQRPRDQWGAAGDYLEMLLLTRPHRRRRQGDWYAGYNAAISILQQVGAIALLDVIDTDDTDV